MFIKGGVFEKELKETRKHYLNSSRFKYDLLSLIPTDLFYLITAVHYNSLFRLPRLFKIHTFWEFYDRMDQVVSSSYFIRVLRTMTYMLFLIHIEGCGYYAMSAYEGLLRNKWVYDGLGSAYIRCAYLATKTATSIGNNPKPVNQDEFLFMTAYWLSGVFVFAMLIGQIRDIFQSAGAAKDHYRKTMDQTVAYMKSLNLPDDLQDKVKTWFTYNWEHQKTLNENSLLEALPKKMKTDLAIHVHFETLSKVNLFQDCDKNLLFDLVLKLNPVLYLPGDYICRKGEIGTEMYILMHGIVEVVGGMNNSVVFATLKEGSVFGEISLLALAGGNRRTADVRSKGFAQLFILSKADFEEAMRDYPAAQKILKRKAKKVLAQNAKHEKESENKEVQPIIQSRPSTPKMLEAVVQVLKPNSTLHEKLKIRRPSFKPPNFTRSNIHEELNGLSPAVSETPIEYLNEVFSDDSLNSVHSCSPKLVDTISQRISETSRVSQSEHHILEETLWNLDHENETDYLGVVCKSTSPDLFSDEYCPDKILNDVFINEQGAESVKKHLFANKFEIENETGEKLRVEKNKSKPEKKRFKPFNNKVNIVNQDKDVVKQAVITTEGEIPQRSSRHRYNSRERGTQTGGLENPMFFASDEEESMKVKQLVTCNVDVHRERSVTSMTSCLDTTELFCASPLDYSLSA